MQLRATRKFAFRIRTRAGLVVEDLQIPGRDVADAVRKIHQLYRGCVILDNHGPGAESGVVLAQSGGGQRQYS